MTRKQKDLLLRDIRSRLPYGIKVKIQNEEGIWRILEINSNGTLTTIRNIGYPMDINLSQCKPYLFPMSSITKKQERKLFEICGIQYINDILYTNSEFTLREVLDGIEWLNSNHFDYRGLIEKGLAINATGLEIY